MVTRRTKGHEGAPSRAVDSIDCTGMSASGGAAKTMTAKTTNGKATARRRWPLITLHSSGQARVRLNGRAHYLGPWASRRQPSAPPAEVCASSPPAAAPEQVPPPVKLAQPTTPRTANA